MKKSKLDKQKTIELAAKGVSQSDIAKTQGVNRSTVKRFLDKHKGELEAARYFADNHGDFLTALQSKSTTLRFDILSELQRRGVEGLSSNEMRSLYHSLTICQGVDFDKSRLLSGQSTENIQTLIADARMLADKMDGL